MRTRAFKCYNSNLTHNAKNLRQNMTSQERHLWYDFLRTYPIKVYRQRVIDGFIVDFYCAKAKLVIEIDGSQHYTEEGIQYDLERSAVLSKYNLSVLRFTNTEIDQQFAAVCQRIDEIVTRTSK